MIYRKRIRKTGYGVRLLTQYIKLECGKRVLYIPFNLGLGKPFGSLRALVDNRRGEFVVHARRRDRMTVGRFALITARIEGWHMGYYDAGHYEKANAKAN
jgi:hypothetical protein